MLPSRQDLAAEYGVALNTLQRAIRALVDEGLLRTDSSRGTFVARDMPAVLNSAVGRSFEVQAGAASKKPVSDAVLGIVLQGTPSELERPELYAPWSAQVAFAMEHAFTGESRLTATYCVKWNASGAYRKAEEAISAALEDGISALAIVDVYGMTGWFEEVASLVDAVTVPTVIVSDRDHKSRVPHIFYDQWAGGYLAARHLIAAGYKRFMFLTPFTDWWLDERIAGARAAVREAGLDDDCFQTSALSDQRCKLEDYYHFSKIRQDELVRQELMKGLETFGLQADGTVAILAPSDHEALALLDVFREMNWSIGNDIGLIGFDDGHPVRVRGITSVRPPMHELGASAARFLLRAVEGERLPDAARIGPSVIARLSTKKG